MDKFDVTSTYGRSSSGTAPRNVDRTALIGDLTAAERKQIQSSNNTFIILLVIVAAIAIAALVLGLMMVFGEAVRRVDGVEPDDGNVNFVAGTFMAITTDQSTNSILFDNTGVGAVVAGPGTTVTTEAGVATVSTTLADQNQLTESDVNGPQVAYPLQHPFIGI